MPTIKLSREETVFLNKEFPSLKYEEGKNVIRGVLSFDLKFLEDGIRIVDEYQIEIDLTQVSDVGIPVIKETQNRIFNIAAKKRMHYSDLHLNNSNGEMCIIIPPKAKIRYPNGFDLKELIMHLQEHLYWVSYFEK